MTKDIITAERLRELLHYDPTDGVFTWRQGYSAYSRITVGSVAGNLDSKGYTIIKIGGRRYGAHRLAWLWMTGEWPGGWLDHINGDRADNRFCNLRPATPSQNQANCRVSSDNTSGFKGVTWDMRRRKFKAQIRINDELIHLGYFDADKPHRAYAVYCLAARKHFGEFARVYEADQLIIPAKVFEERVLGNLLVATQPDYARAA
jgi:hypothetical protein